MKRLPWPVLAMIGWVVFANQGQAQNPVGPGPGNQPANLRLPWEGGPVPITLPPYAGGTGTAGTGFAAGTAAYQEKPDPNLDLYVSPAHGPWMICVNWYSGPESAVMARKMVMELRDQYKLPAFVFSKGAEERKQEFERVKALIDKQREVYRMNNLPQTAPLRVKHRRIEDQYAVLVGGYPDDKAVHKALVDIRQLKPPDPKRVPLPTKWYQDKDEQTGKVKSEEVVYVNPFSTAFVVRNPAVKIERPAEWNKLDMALLQKLNRGEPFSLLTCKKPYTLVVKDFPTPAVVQPITAPGSFLGARGLAGRTGGVDTSAQNAHNLAEVFRKTTNLEAFVLHTRCASFVTVGGFDSPDDPNLRAMQTMLTSRLKVPQALPMAVPR